MCYRISHRLISQFTSSDFFSFTPYFFVYTSIVLYVKNLKLSNQSSISNNNQLVLDEVLLSNASTTFETPTQVAFSLTIPSFFVSILSQTNIKYDKLQFQTQRLRSPRLLFSNLFKISMIFFLQRRRFTFNSSVT